MWTVMMKFIYVAVAVLSFLSIGQSAPVISCETLTHPIEISGREQLLGTWTYIAEATNIPASKLLTKMLVESVRVKVTAVANESDAVNIIQSQKMFGGCFAVTSKATLVNGILSTEKPIVGSSARLPTGCPDCLVLLSNYTIGERTYNGVQLMSTRNNVTAAELEEFTKQVECLNLPAPAIMDPKKAICPVDSSSQETNVTDLTMHMNNMGSEVLRLFDELVNSKNGLDSLLKMISSGVTELKDN